MKTTPTNILLRTGLIIALGCGLAVGTLNVIKVKGKITRLQSDLSRQMAARDAAEGTLANTRRDLGTALSTLKQTRGMLETTTLQKEQAQAEAKNNGERLQVVNQNLDQTTGERDDALAYLERYRLSGMEPEDVLNAGRELKKLRTAITSVHEENGVLAMRVKQLEARLTPLCEVTLPAQLKGKILVYDPKWAFVVLDAGTKEGMLTNGELLVMRSGKLVGKVKVSQVQDDRSIANLIPGWQLGEVSEGDVVIPAHPSS
ncbi:MAG TPA: hypothetical protein VLT36_14805 [Candidatus Dormibacteraeota bacterium]|nr:hypothetical protein [Candidatus Dormibacteraeota bacterium]